MTDLEKILGYIERLEVLGKAAKDARQAFMVEPVETDGPYNYRLVRAEGERDFAFRSAMPVLLGALKDSIEELRLIALNKETANIFLIQRAATKSLSRIAAMLPEEETK